MFYSSLRMGDVLLLTKISTSNSDYVIGNSNLPDIKAHTKSSFKKLLCKNKLIYSQVLVLMMK